MFEANKNITNYEEAVIVTGHEDYIYNGVYHLAETWGGYPHWAKEDRSAHIYYYYYEDDTHQGTYWNIDRRDQKVFPKIYNFDKGGYFSSSDYSNYGVLGQNGNCNIEMAYKPICAYTNSFGINFYKFEFSRKTIKETTRKRCVSKYQLHEEDHMDEN